MKLNKLFKKINNRIDSKSPASDCRRQGGFTLIEVMIAVFIITQAVVALISLSTSSFFITKYANNEIVANNLMQEGLDYVRNDRDSIAFGQSDTLGWDSFKEKYNFCFEENGCYINMIDDQVGICENGDCPYFYYDKDAKRGRFYNYYTADGFSTSFSSKIRMWEVTPDIVNVSVVLRWKNGNLEKTRVLSTSLSNWLQ